jgi:hypothetical protein
LLAARFDPHDVPFIAYADIFLTPRCARQGNFDPDELTRLVERRRYGELRVRDNGDASAG